MSARATAMRLVAGCLAASLWACARGTPPRPSVLLVTLEGVRADRIGAYGEPRARTPSIDALARDGVLFERAYAAAPLCLPAVATILTGRGPGSHGVHEDAFVSLATSVPLLSEALRSAGYRTGAFVGSGVLGRESGLLRGFDEAVDDFGTPGKQPGRTESGTPAETVDAASRWIAVPSSPAPWFAWVHLRRAPVAAGATTPEAYDASLAAADLALGRLIDASRRRAPSLVVALIADHGESLGDHGEEGFGYFVYGATTRVPLVISYPGALPQGHRVAPVVRAMDLAPTLLDLAGIEPPGGLQGASLAALATGKVKDGPGPAIVENASLEARYGISPVFALVSGPHLYVRAPRPELYDVAQDPGATVDLSDRLSRVAGRLDTELGRSVPPARPGLADPKDALERYRRYREAQDLDARGERARAIAAYRHILEESGGFVQARRKLAETLLQEKQTKEAQGLLEDLVAKGQANETTFLNLALARYRQGDAKGALLGLREGLKAFPGSVALQHRAGRLLLELGQPGEAVLSLAQAVRLEPRLVDAQLALGEALQADGRKPEAEGAFREVLKVAGSDSAEARKALAALGEPGSGPR